MIFLGISVQVHDELVLEVDPSVMKEAGLLLKMTMENSTSLLGMSFAFTSYIYLFLRTNIH